MIFRLRILRFFDKFRDFSNILPCFVHYFALPNAHHCVKDDFVFMFFVYLFVRSYKRVSRLFVFSVMLSVIAVLGVLFFCINDLFDVHLFVLFLRAEVRSLLVLRFLAVLACCLVLVRCSI